jgi:hypothetical protein
VLAAELRRLLTWGERHRRLTARLTLALLSTLLVDAICTILVWEFESGVNGGDIHGFGDALFFSTVQLLTVSSQIRNPLSFRPDRRRLPRGVGNRRRGGGGRHVRRVFRWRP